MKIHESQFFMILDRIENLCVLILPEDISRYKIKKLEPSLLMINNQISPISGWWLAPAYLKLLLQL